MRSFFLIAILLTGIRCCAQDKVLATTRAFLAGNNYMSALQTINTAIEQPTLKNNPEAWFLRGVGYLMQAMDSTSRDPNASKEAWHSLMRALALKPDYGPEINAPLYGIAILKFNAAVTAYSVRSYRQAYSEFLSVNAIYQSGKTKRFAGNKEFAELSVDARRNAAYSAINAGQDNDARPILEELVKTDAKDDIGVYQSLIEIYEVTRNADQQIATIKAARQQFPANDLFTQMERDYYRKTAQKR